MPYPPSYLLGSLINCSGDEASLTKCRLDYDGVNGSVLGTCKWKSSMGVVCEPVKLRWGKSATSVSIPVLSDGLDQSVF
jgi:hypothetical protein